MTNCTVVTAMMNATVALEQIRKMVVRRSLDSRRSIVEDKDRSDICIIWGPVLDPAILSPVLLISVAKSLVNYRVAPIRL